MKLFNKYSIIILLIFYSCDLLTTRVPENPESPGTTFISATIPEILFQNLRASFEEKILENYMACFVDSSYLKKTFIFIPANTSISQYPILNNWSLYSEKQYFNNLKSNLNQGSSINVTFSNIISNPLGDSAIYSIDYSILISSNNQTIAGEYKGTGQFKIFLDSRKQWSIVEWQDIKKENFLSWSDLKGRTY